MNSSHSEKTHISDNPVFVYLLHMNLTMVFGICGNLFLAFVIWRGSKVTKHRISPVQVRTKTKIEKLHFVCILKLIFSADVSRNMYLKVIFDEYHMQHTSL